MLEGYDRTINQLRAKVTIQEPIDIRESVIELNNVLSAIDRNLSILDEGNRIREIQACILFLLQGSRIKVDHLDGIESVELKIAVNPSKFLCLKAMLHTPLKVMDAAENPLYPMGIEYEIITSAMKFIPENVDGFGFGFFNGVLNAKRREDGKILYSLIR